MFEDTLTLVLHQGSQSLLLPVVGVLVLLVLAIVFCVGETIVEYFSERRYFKVNHLQVVADMHDADYEDIRDVITHAALLRPQIRSLCRIADNMGLPDDELFAIASIELERTDRFYERRVNITDTVAKIAPMFGLMGTLIPLGPGIVAMGQGDVSQLSSSLLIAFDTTVAGLITAAVALVISRIHKTWYGQYHTVMQALMSCVLEEAAQARDAGLQLPYGSAGPELEELQQAEKGALKSTGRFRRARAAEGSVS